MKQRFYPAVLERGGNGYFGLWFPDFPGAVAAGKSQEEAMAKGHDALAAAMEARVERENTLPEPTPVESVAIPDDCDFVSFLAVGATPPDPSERVNVYLPRSLIERVDRTAADWGMTRSSFFGLAVTRLAMSPAGGAGVLAATKVKMRP